MNAEIAALARMPNHLDVFSVDDDGRVSTSWWHEGAPWSARRHIGGFFPPGAPIAAVSRNPHQLDLFVVGSNGVVYTSAWSSEHDWSGIDNNWRRIGGFFPPGAPVAAVSRNPDQVDLFVVGHDGVVYTSWWSPGQERSGWDDPWRAIGGFFLVGSSITAVSRKRDQLDLFVVGANGLVYTSWWSPDSEWSGIGNNWRAIGGFFPAGAPVAAVARLPEQLDLFVVGTNGIVYTSWWNSNVNWSGVDNNWRAIGGFFPSGAPIAAVSRNPHQLDLFVVGSNGVVYTSAWSSEHDWSGIDNNWRRIGGFFPPGAPIAAVSRNPDHIDLFVTGNDRRIYTSWWRTGYDWSGRDDNWYAVGSIVLQQPIPERDGFGGRVKLTLHDDGAVRLLGHAANTALQAYEFRVRVVVRSGSNIAIAMQRSGRVAGSFGQRPEVHWDETAIHPLIATSFEDFRRESRLEVFVTHKGEITGALADLADIVLRWLAGSAVVTSGVGLVIFLGVEIGSLIGTGSLAPGGRVVDGILWLAGPSGSLFALAGAGLAQLGSHERELMPHEYNWAREAVFEDSLPPREQLILTDSLGLSGRAFVFPRYDGKIAINMGPRAFADPRAESATFIHELVHAWQIYHTDMDLVWLANALLTQACDVVTGNGYGYSLGTSARPFRAFNLEQQAQIVEDWYTDGRRANSPLMPYIDGNIRLGAL